MKKTFFQSLSNKIEATWGIKQEFRLKVLFLTTAFAMLMACQAIWRPLKSAVFISMVGAKNIPIAKILLLFPIMILILIYSKLVDWLRRHHLFYWFAISHAIVGIILFFLLKHPVYGLANTVKSSSRLLGWGHYFFMESFGAFMSAVFWSFANSVNKPKDAKNYYSLFVAGAKIGGIIGASALLAAAIFVGGNAKYGDVSMIANFTLAGSILLLLAAGAIYLLMKHVPGYMMHGYEAAYQFEKQTAKAEAKSKTKKSLKTSLWESVEGVWLIIKNPYVFGILGMILSYEVISAILDYLFALAAEGSSTGAVGIAAYYALYTLMMHSIGFLIAIFGTAPIQRFLGIRFSLFICPTLTLLTLIAVFIFPSAQVIFLAVVFSRALNYGLNHPTREALFIPTTKAIKFKAKAWTDAFGSRMGKAGGSFLNKFVLLGLARLSSVIGLVIAAGWLLVAYVLGKKFQETVDQNKVIGTEDQEQIQE